MQIHVWISSMMLLLSQIVVKDMILMILMIIGITFLLYSRERSKKLINKPKSETPQYQKIEESNEDPLFQKFIFSVLGQALLYTYKHTTIKKQ